MASLLRKLSLALAIALSWIGFALPGHADEMDDILKRGELRIAVQTQGPPVSFIDRNGKRTGLAIELAEMMAKDLGVKLVIQDYDWKALIPALLAGKVDMIAADMAPTPQRAAQLLFSRPMFYQETAAFALKDSPLKTWQEANAEGKLVGATQASSYAAAAKRYMPKATLKEFSGGTVDVAQAVSTGRIDAGVSDVANIRTFIKEYGNLKILENAMAREPLAFAVNPSHNHLKFWLDNYIEVVSADKRLDELLDYWWNSDAWEKDHK
ncbi:ABC transporter substrate-binding protein [Microvirga sp. W0021]|uniref:ABC transporter substrate-binding protein n=1 Tax=Hohaiivirga grylli TaxID=3133970 RepID=A0ABV0BKJ9_9HYPH